MQLDFTTPAPIFAPQLIGWELLIDDEQGLRGGTIIETEAYTVEDPASHSYRGQTNRNASMFKQPGTIYIYQIYGKHFCLNFVCGNADGQAVLVRAILPTVGVPLLKQNRHTTRATQLTNGPAKLVEAMKIPRTINGKHISDTTLTLRAPQQQYQITATARIGISQATDVLWRFVGQTITHPN